MRASMSRLTPRFSANRVVREYTETYYTPLAAAYRARAERKGALGADLLQWRRGLAEHWREARFGVVRAETRGAEHHVTVDVYLGDLDPAAVRVELYADPVNGEKSESRIMAPTRKLDEPGNGYEYHVSLSASRPLGDYTPRLVPYHPAAAVPLETHEILWQR
jgi:starch phosphorylase